MKLLTVVIASISMYCVNCYTIFPLPGQSAPKNPKFGRFESLPLNSAQSVTATKILPFLSTLPPLPSTSYYQTTRVPVITTSRTPPQQSVTSYQNPKAPEVIAATLSTLSSYTSTSKSPKPSFVQNIHTSPTTVAAVSPLASDLLPPLETADIKPKVLKPIKPEIEAPARDLLPPKLS